MGVRVVLAEGERIGQALQRFHKLLQRQGINRELRRRKNFEKPSQYRRAKRFNKRFKARKATLLAKQAGQQPASSISESLQTFWERTGKR